MTENIFERMIPEPVKIISSELKRIQEKHIDWFNSESNKRGDIDFHYFLSYNQEGISFGFEPDSNLPTNIRTECETKVSEILSQ